MEQGRREIEPRASGVALRVRFALTMTLALAVVMAVAGLMLSQTTAKLVRENQERAFVEALHNLNAPDAEAGYEQVGTAAMALDAGDVNRFEVRYGPDLRKPGYLYQETAKSRDKKINLIVPADVVDKTGSKLLGLIVAVTLSVILVGAVVAFIVGNNVSRPLEQIVEDVRQISRGDLEHRTHVRGSGGEVGLLAKSIDRMTDSLREAQDAQVELSVREHELAVAGEVREALMPESEPSVPGYDLGALHVGSPTPGGDFFDFVETADGRVGLLVCDVSGRGIPGALVGATARAYLRVELAAGGDVAEALRRVNRRLAGDVRRGMYVTALVALLDPASGELTVACAGHKVPLLRYTAADQKIRVVQPEGIALGFDKGPVFDRTLQPTTLTLEAGDRILIANTGPLHVVNPGGEELGEKAFYRLVLQHAARTTAEVVKLLSHSLEKFADGAPFPGDIAVVSVARKA
jgi:serine phosphatase RsbU (regulator of sigma subunit)